MYCPLSQKISGWKPQLQKFISARVDTQEAEDVLQETWTRFFQYSDISRLENPQGYLFQVARNVICDHWAKKNLENLAEELDIDEHVPDVSPEPQYSNLMLDQLFQLIEDMPVKRREVFVRRRLLGESREEIAVSLNTSVEAVKKNIHRAFTDLSFSLKRVGWQE